MDVIRIKDACCSSQFVLAFVLFAHFFVDMIRGLKCFTLLLLLLVIAILQLNLHLLPVSLFEVLFQKSVTRRNVPDGNDEQQAQQRIDQTSVLDVSGEFSIIANVIHSEWDFDSASNNMSSKDVTLVTQCSLSGLRFLPFLSQRWSASLSIALFVMQHEVYSTIRLIEMLRKCYPTIRKYCNFHIVFPAARGSQQLQSVNENSRIADRLLEKVATNNNKCAELNTYLHDDLKISAHNYGEQKAAYPNNLLRNVARRYSGTDFIFLIDIDMVPSLGLRDAFLNFAERSAIQHRIAADYSSDSGYKKLVYVVPVYEIPENVEENRIPRDKRDLLQMVMNHEARPFYIELCWKCHKVTDYATWEREYWSKDEGERNSDKQQQQQKWDQGFLSILQTVTWKDGWEPFYIGLNDVPFYDERFKQYGFNRMSQVCEMYVAGFDFAVLDKAFVVHRGWKRSDSFHAEKEVDQQRNRILFRQFKSSLKNKYPTGVRSCN